MKEIVILGAGGLAREVAFLIRDINKIKRLFNLLGFIDKNKNMLGTKIGDYEIIGDEGWLTDKNICVAIGIGSPKTICRIADKFVKTKNLEFPNFVHPKTVWDKKTIKLGRGNIISAGNIFTTDIEIGSYNIINLNSTYGHDVKIGDCSVLSPGLNVSGRVSIGSKCYIGTGAKILQGCKIGNGAIVGAGAVVTRDVKAKTTVAGVPAKLLSKS